MFQTTNQTQYPCSECAANACKARPGYRKRRFSFVECTIAVGSAFEHVWKITAAHVDMFYIKSSITIGCSSRLFKSQVLNFCASEGLTPEDKDVSP